jgi:hypothetical protein
MDDLLEVVAAAFMSVIDLFIDAVATIVAGAFESRREP